ncbi:unnamed protein product, partial [Symbiodinium necroappetens]
MAKNGKFNPFPDPKKGVRRMIQKKPSCKKSTSWMKIPYVKDNTKGGYVRKEQTKWRRCIQELPHATDREILQILIQDGLLPDRKGSVCPHCQAGTLSALTTNGRDDILRYRCSRKGCQWYFLPQHLHPIYTATKGPEGHALQVQAAALLLRLLNTSSIHILTHINHKALEKMSRNLMITRKGYVQQEEKKIKFGGCPRAWKEVEDKEDDGKPALWEQWGAIIQRGNPKTLVLTKLNPAMTVPRAPGPGAIRKADWKPLATRLLKNRQVILHTDSARSYRMKLPGVVHDAVVHKKRKVKKNNKWMWLKPTFVRISKH